MIGETMIVGGLISLVGVKVFERRAKLLKKSKKVEDSLKENGITLGDRTEILSKLFENMGIIDSEKGDWIRVEKYVDKPCYTMTKMVISDSISLSSLTKKIDDIKQKLGERFLEIYPEGQHICFRSRKQITPLPSYEYKKTKQTLINLGLGLDDELIQWDLTKEPHLGIFAESGAGKSRLQQAIMLHIIQNIPSCHLYVVDFKNGVELARYQKLENCKMFAKDVKQAKAMIAHLEEMANNRYDIMAKEGYTNFNRYVKDKPRSKMKRTFVVFDEFADLVDDCKTKKKNDDDFDAVLTLVRLGRKLRACGVHLILATQRPTVDFIPSSLKSNLGNIIGMKTLNKRNSQLILEMDDLAELEQSQAIGKINSKIVFFRSYFLPDDDKLLDDIIDRCANYKYGRPVDEKDVSVDLGEERIDEPKKDNVVDVEYTPCDDSPFV